MGNFFMFITGILMLLHNSGIDNVQFSNDKKCYTKKYYLKYKLPEDDSYYIATVNEFDEIEKLASDFKLFDYKKGNTLSSELSNKILNSDDVNIMLGCGKFVEVWHYIKDKTDKPVVGNNKIDIWFFIGISLVVASVYGFIKELFFE